MEMRLSGNAFQILAAATGKARLPTVESLKDNEVSRLMTPVSMKNADDKFLPFITAMQSTTQTTNKQQKMPNTSHVRWCSQFWVHDIANKIIHW